MKALAMASARARQLPRRADLRGGGLAIRPGCLVRPDGAVQDAAESWRRSTRRCRRSWSIRGGRALHGISFEPKRMPAAEVRTFITSEIDKWGRLVKAAGIEKEWAP